MKPRHHAIVILVLFFGLTGCDKACKYNVIDQAQVRNLTGSQLSLTVCKDIKQKQEITVPSDEESTVALGPGVETKVVGGPTAKCPSHIEEIRNVGFALSAASFNDVQLCFSQDPLEYIFVDVDGVCPEGTRMQTSPRNCD